MTVVFEALWENPDAFPANGKARTLLDYCGEHVESGAEQASPTFVNFLKHSGDTAWLDTVHCVQDGETYKAFKEAKSQLLNSMPYIVWKLYVTHSIESQHLMAPHAEHMERFFRKDFFFLPPTFQRNIVRLASQEEDYIPAVAWNAFKATADNYFTHSSKQNFYQSGMIFARDIKWGIWKGYLQERATTHDMEIPDNMKYLEVFLEWVASELTEDMWERSHLSC